MAQVRWWKGKLGEVHVGEVRVVALVDIQPPRVPSFTLRVPIQRWAALVHPRHLSLQLCGMCCYLNAGHGFGVWMGEACVTIRFVRGCTCSRRPCGRWLGWACGRAGVRCDSRVLGCLELGSLARHLSVWRSPRICGKRVALFVFVRLSCGAC